MASDLKSYYDNVKEYMADKLMRAEQQLRRAEDNSAPPHIILILHQLTKQLRKIYKDLILPEFKNK